MMGFVLVFSWMPLVIDFGLGESNPLLFNAGLSLGKIIGVVIYLRVAFPHVFSSEALRLIASRTCSKAMLLGSLSHMTYALFSWSTTLVDTVISTIVYETWPILYLALLGWVVSGIDGTRRYRALGVSDYFCCLLAFAGLAYVVIGTTGIGPSLDSDYASQALGIGLALAAAALSALNVYNFSWGVDLHKALPKHLSAPDGGNISEIACVMIGFALSSFFALVISAPPAFVIGGGISSSSAAVSILAGAGVLAAGSVLFRQANLRSKDPSVNVLAYVTPLVALGWLSLFTEIAVENFELIVIGAAAIVAMNVLLNLRPEQQIGRFDRLGFRALVLSLWVIGAFIYSRDELLPSEWLTWSSNMYWQILSLSATVFTLVLSFRVNRVANRTSEENNQSAALLRKLQHLFSEQTLQDVGVINSFFEAIRMNSARAREEYMALRAAVKKASPSCSWMDLADIEARLDMLIHSKQQGREFGEIVAIAALAVMTVGLAILSRPELSGWHGFLVESFLVVFLSTILYLVVNLADLRRERFSGLFEQDNADYPIVPFENKSLKQDGVWALVMSLMIVSAFGYALYAKWLA